MTLKSSDTKSVHATRPDHTPLPKRGAMLVLLLATTAIALFIDKMMHWLYPDFSLVVVALINLGLLVGLVGPLGYMLLLKPYARLIAAYRAGEERLRRSESFLRATLDALPDHIAILDAQGKILAVNNGWRRFAEENGPVNGNVNEGADYYGVCRAAEGEDAREARDFAQGIDAVLRGAQESFALEYSCHSPGIQRWFIGRVRALHYDGAPRVVVSHRDITARRLAENSLRHSEALYRTMFETSGNIKLIIAQDGTILRCNSQAEIQLGYTRAEMEGVMNWRTFIDPVDLPAMEKLDGDLWDEQGPASVNAEIRFRSRQGQLRYVLMAANRIAGTRQSFVSLADYSVRRAMNEALLENQNRLFRQHEELHQLFHQVETIKQEWEQTLDCLDDIVVLTDAQGCIRRCNRALQSVMAGDYHSLIGLPLTDLLGALEVHAESGLGDGVMLHDPSTGRFLLSRTYSFSEGGAGESGTVVTLQDVTRMRRMSGELAAANRALEAKRRELQQAYDDLKAGQQRILQQEKMASLGQLAAGVAHEINNPIGYMSSNLGTLQKYLARLEEFFAAQEQWLPENSAATADLAQKRRALKIDHILADIPHLLDESLEGAQRVKQIVQDLKNFSRLDAGEPLAADLVECLESTINIVWNEIKYKAELVRDYEALPPLVCHAQQLGQVFINLLVNAAQAIDKRGTICVRTRHEGDWLSIAVSDTGGGIAPEHLSKLFDPFFTTKQVGQGTGLGLAIAYEIVKKHGGEISVDSTPGEGSTFTLRLPLGNSGQGILADTGGGA
ncbi:PAS domain S-box-containing protein [Geoalkalibacter ferrihydriticus]|uniref:histidine kinase n=1 Tax=Geoalkalibacter ferrihydriticus TaxID=392333 RepID=A0A1G9IIV4_9BACT|nr:ATP-binding protein [Geoalkalibacter ferrihydriticus]SDL25062.1 PAS domain S-box-containing protein [Geoalkalibacter ferrihydriticus]